jgi:putative dehydrogenase
MRNNVAPAVKDALADSVDEVFGYTARQMPRMFPKAYRWVAEMEEIAAFTGADPAATASFAAAARLYERLAADYAAAGPEVAALTQFLA